MSQQEDKLAKELRSAYKEKGYQDKMYYNKDRVKKPTTPYEQNRETYTKRVRKLKKDNPDAFQGVQERNTEAVERVLNTIDFDRDPYAQDPISQKAFEDMQYNVNVPFGYQDSKGGAYTLPGRALGTTMAAKNHPEKGRIDISSGATLPEMMKNRLGLAGLLRHEGQHRVSPDSGHPEINALDRLYQMELKGHDRDLRDSEAQRPATKSEMTSLMLDAKNKARGNRRLGNPNVYPEGTEERMEWDRLAELPAKEQLKAVQSAGEYELSGKYLHRDLPNKGWWDEMWYDPKK